MARKKRKAAPIPVMEMDLPTVEQLKTGCYVREFITNADTGSKAMAHRSLRDPVLRWERDGKITDMQASTIRRMQGLWQAVHGLQRLTARYDEPCAPSTGGNACGREAQLRDDLRRIEGYFEGVRQYYMVFERVCRFGFTAPQACETNDVSERAARDKALVIVQFVSDFIATREGW
jgi:hypothetical protein